MEKDSCDPCNQGDLPAWIRFIKHQDFAGSSPLSSCGQSKNSRDVSHAHRQCIVGSLAHPSCRPKEVFARTRPTLCCLLYRYKFGVMELMSMEFVGHYSPHTGSHCKSPLADSQSDLKELGT